MIIPKPEQMSSGNWFIRLRLNGENVNITARTERECIKQEELIKAKHRNRVNQRFAGRDLPLTVAIDNYLEDRENVLSPSTIVGYRNIQRNRFQTYMNRPLVTINWQQAVNLEARLASPKTVKNAFGFMRSVCRENGVDIPPIRLPSAIKKEKQWLTPEQIQVFIKAFEGERHEIAALLGLHSLRTIYTHLSKSDTQKSVKKLTEFFGETEERHVCEGHLTTQTL